MSLTASLLAAYTFESAGTHLGDDASGISGNLTNHGSTPQAAGNASPGSNAASFSATNTIYLGNAGPVINFANTDFTITCWAYVTATEGYDQFLTGMELFPCHTVSLWAGTSNGATKQFKFITNSSGGGGAESGTAIADGQANYSLNTWNFVAASVDNGAKLMYIDRNNSGSPASVSYSAIFTGTPNGLLVGATPDFGGGFGLSGRVDALNIWNRKLSAAELTTLYNGGVGLEYPFTSGRRRGSIAFL